MKNLKFIVVLGLLLLASISPGNAQDKEEIIKVDTVLLNMPVIVGDRQGRYLADLKKEDFTVTQNGKNQTIEFFAGTEVPMNVAIVLDLSCRTPQVLDDMKKAALEFVKVLRPEDKGMVAGYATGMEIYSLFTSDQKALSKAIRKADSMQPAGPIMLDALYDLQTWHFEPLKGRKAIIILTTGVTWGSRISENQFLNAFAESDTIVYPIYFETEKRKTPLPDPETATAAELKDTPLEGINAISGVTGGRVYKADSTNLETIFQQIANELKMQYVVGFYPEKDAAGKMLPLVKVAVDRPDAVVRTKRVIKLKTPAEQSGATK